MARDIYQNTIALAAPDGTLRALADIQVYVYRPGTQDTVTIYSGRTGPEQAGNPLLTDATGAVEFYAEVGEYDIRIMDSQRVPRIADRTTSWNAFNGSAQGLPSRIITRDGGIDLTALANDIKRQLTQIGQVIDWWRPNNTVSIPSGFAICDGRTIAAADHDFGTGAPVQLPDLRNQFIIGADPFKTDGAASSNGDGSAASGAQHPNAPGIRGVGGSNTTKNLQHSHQFAHTHNSTVPDHFHQTTTVDHIHSPPGIGVSVGMGNANRGTSSHPSLSGSGEGAAFTAHVHGLSASGWAGNTGNTGNHVSNSGGSSSGAPTITTWSQSTTTTDNGNAASAADMRPRHVGLLKLMKVKAS